MEPIICEECYEFFNSPSDYLSHKAEAHKEEEGEE
jgi:hypothetical protein